VGKKDYANRILSGNANIRSYITTLWKYFDIYPEGSHTLWQLLVLPGHLQALFQKYNNNNKKKPIDYYSHI
jgi:hypothetical protein